MSHLTALVGVLLAAAPLATTAEPNPLAPGDRGAAVVAAGDDPAAEYRLGAGDLLRVSVFQNPDLNLETRITEGGAISYPLVGALRLAGLPVPMAEARIAEALQQGSFVRNPQVTLTVLQVRGHQAAVIGLVHRPGRYPLEAANTRLTDLLALAGGATESAADSLVVSGVRDGLPFRAEVDLPALFAPGGRALDLVVRHGDVVWVARQPQVFIYGEVQRPGVIRLARDMTVMQALASGGGLTPRGTERGIRVHRKTADGNTSAQATRITDRLQDGDVVFVKESLF